MKKYILIIAVCLDILLTAAQAQNSNNNGHHAGGGNSGNGKGNGAGMIAPEDLEPGEPGGDPDVNVPIDNWVWVLVACAVGYGFLLNKKGAQTWQH